MTKPSGAGIPGIAENSNHSTTSDLAETTDSGEVFRIGKTNYPFYPCLNLQEETNVNLKNIPTMSNGI
jgi:hypothetical protein